MPTLVFMLTIATVVLWGVAALLVWLRLPPPRQPVAVAYLAVPVVALTFVAFGGEAVGDVVMGLAAVVGLVLWLDTGLRPEEAIEFHEEEPERITHRTGELLMRRQLSVVGATALLMVILIITLPWLRDVQWLTR
ncbi:hypothetical protein [Kutzneria kofuensis]|uniref:L-lactate permease n=1 Tax=Kutzneria kofuensis TaxID=103725 RepID=A0A7W9KLE8_9PSEU|nr:hypothetical protein [Kutzneria kofuensis]MBB5894719.1 L-lactate permease [Kutzneria kofuensis]